MFESFFRSLSHGRVVSRVRRGHNTAVVLCVTLLAGVASAADGVIEINQASALAGVAVGDAPGFPVTLALRGSYVLTSELNAPPDTTAIVFQNDHVHLDMNGFAIVGGGGTTGFGIETASSVARGQRVVNGSVRSFPRGGVFLGDESHVEHVIVIDSGGNGILLGENGLVQDSTAVDSGVTGIRVGEGSSVLDSRASDNGGTGITAESSVVSRCSVSRNASDGISATGSSSITENVAHDNDRYGIFAARGVVLGNTATANDGFGLRLTTAGYANNFMDANDLNGAAIEVSGGVEMGPNVCNGVLCPPSP